LAESSWVYVDCEFVGVASDATWSSVVERLGLSNWQADWTDDWSSVQVGSSKLMLKLWPTERDYILARDAVTKRLGLSFWMCSFYDDCTYRDYNANGSGACSEQNMSFRLRSHTHGFALRRSGLSSTTPQRNVSTGLTDLPKRPAEVSQGPHREKIDTEQ
jgi:hypothetical protein